MIEKLENNEQVLLMYLADELPAEDRHEVEQMLSIDSSLRSEFANLQNTQNWLSESLSLLDDAMPMPVSADFAARQVGREIRQRVARPKAPPVVIKFERPVRSWRWLYPTATAASIAILAMIWLGRQAMPSHSPYSLPAMPPSSGNSSLADGQSDANVNLLMQSLQSPMGSDQPDVKPPSSTDDDSRQVALGDAVPQDEISQYLLSAKAGGN